MVEGKFVTISCLIILMSIKFGNLEDVAISNRLSLRLCKSFVKSIFGKVLPQSLDQSTTCPAYEKEGSSKIWTFYNCEDEKTNGGNSNGSPIISFQQKKKDTERSGILKGQDTFPITYQDKKESRIMNGQEAPPFIHRYLVYIRARGVLKGLSGTIYNKYTIIASALELDELLGKTGNNLASIEIHVGKSMNSKRENEEQIRLMCDFTHHPKYSPGSGKQEYGFTAIHLYDPITFNNYADLIPFANDSQTSTLSNRCLVPGWGNPVAQAENITTEKVQHANATLQSCPSDLQRLGNEICSNPFACWGDGGSPAVCTDRGNIYASALTGVLSDSSSCQNSKWTILYDLKRDNIKSWAEEAFQKAEERCRPCEKLELF